ncbi:MAG: hypothetical protein ABFD07_19700 [Methanobacterium sp.]
MDTFYYICLFVFSILAFSYIHLKYLEYRSSRKQTFIKNFESYAVTLEYHMKKAFDIIYKEKILIYSMEATRLNQSEFNTVSRDFISLTLKFLGPSLAEEYEFLYGNKETFYFIIVEYFNNRYEQDEIYKTSTSDLMTQGAEENKT